MHKDSRYLRPVRSLPKKLTTPTLNTKLEKTVKRPAMPSRYFEPSFLRLLN